MFKPAYTHSSFHRLQAMYKSISAGGKLNVKSLTSEVFTNNFILKRKISRGKTNEIPEKA